MRDRKCITSKTPFSFLFDNASISTRFPLFQLAPTVKLGSVSSGSVRSQSSSMRDDDIAGEGHVGNPLRDGDGDQWLFDDARSGGEKKRNSSPFKKSKELLDDDGLSWRPSETSFDREDGDDEVRVYIYYPI